MPYPISYCAWYSFGAVVAKMRNIWAMKKPWLFRVYRGWKTTQLCGDCNKPWNKDPVIKQSAFHGSSIRPFFFLRGSYDSSFSRNAFFGILRYGNLIISGNPYVIAHRLERSSGSYFSLDAWQKRGWIWIYKVYIYILDAQMMSIYICLHFFFVKEDRGSKNSRLLCTISSGFFAVWKGWRPGDSKCPFHPLVGGHLTPWKGHLTIPKRSLWITRDL